MTVKRNEMADKWPTSATKCAAKIGHLLTVLTAPNIAIRVDETSSEPHILAYQNHKGVSLSRGSFPLSALKALVSEGCVHWKPGTSHVTITPEGEARIRRANASKLGTEALGVSAFSAQHKHLNLQEKSVEAAGGVQVKYLRLRDENESPLAWLAKRKNKAGIPLISQVQYLAGERLRADLTVAAMLPKVTANWAATGCGQPGASPQNPFDIILAARQRTQKALVAVGPEFSGILVDLCGFLKGLEQIEHERSWPPRSAKVVLGLALTSLATHYGFTQMAQGKNFSPMRRWAAPDARPTLG